MSQKDKVKLLVAVVVLALAGGLIWYNLRETAPEPPKPAPSGAVTGEAPPVPAPGGRGRVLPPG